MSKNVHIHALSKVKSRQRMARGDGKRAGRAAEGVPAIRKGATRPVAGEPLTIRELGWTREEAGKVRAQMASFAVDWDDPVMDIYNEP